MGHYDAHYYVFCSMLHYGLTKKETFSVGKEVAKLSQRGRERICVLVIQYVAEGNEKTP